MKWALGAGHFLAPFRTLLIEMMRYRYIIEMIQLHYVICSDESMYKHLIHSSNGKNQNQVCHFEFLLGLLIYNIPTNGNHIYKCKS